MKRDTFLKSVFALALLLSAIAPFTWQDGLLAQSGNISGLASSSNANHVSSPMLTLLSKENLKSEAGSELVLDVDVSAWTGLCFEPLEGVPVVFSVAEGDGFLSNEEGNLLSRTITVYSEDDGIARVYYEQPDEAGVISVIRASVESGDTLEIEVKTASEIPFFLKSAAAMITEPVKNGMQFWFKADEGVAVQQNGNILRWNDVSGCGAYAMASGSTELKANQLNGSPVVYFNGINSYLRLLGNVHVNSGAKEMFIVLRPGPYAKGKSAYGLSHFFPVRYPDSNNTTILDSFGSNATISFNADVNGWRIYNVSSDSSAWTAFLNGNQVMRKVSPVPTFISQYYIGGDSGGKNNWQGEIAEIIMYQRKLSDTERETVRQYLDGKYDINNASIEWNYPEPKPDTPVFTKLKQMLGSQVLLSWDSILSSSGTEVLRSLDGVNWDTVAADAYSTYFVDSGLIGGMEYLYRVRVQINGFWSDWSNIGSAVTSDGNCPVATDKLELWLDAGNGITLKDGFISRWDDISGREGYAYGSVGKIPVLAETALNGKPVVSFQNSTQYLMVNKQIKRDLSQVNKELFIVLKPGSGSLGKEAYSFGDMYGTMFPLSQGVIRDGFGLASPVSFSANTEGWHLYNVRVNTQEWVAHLDGLQKHKVINPRVYAGSACFLGGKLNAGWGGNVAEVLLYDRVLADAERAGIERYLANKYGLNVPIRIVDMPENVSLGISDGKVRLSWGRGNNGTGVTYIIERREKGGSWATIGNTSGTDFSDATAQAGKKYEYRVRGVLGDYSSQWSDLLAVALPLPFSAPESGLRLWLRADQGVAQENGRVSLWKDYGSLKKNVSVAQTEKRPMLAYGVLNAFPAVRFDGENDVLDLDNRMSGASSGDVFIVLKSNRADNGLWTFGVQNGAAYPDMGGSIVDDFGSISEHNAVADSFSDAWRLYTVTSSAGAWENSSNGAVLSSYGNNQVAFPTSVLLGQSKKNFFKGDIAEILVYNRILTDAERSLIGAYLVQKYNLFGVPEKPDDFEAIVLSSGGIGLRWNPSLAGTTYTVERKVVNGTTETWTTVGEVRGGDIYSMADYGLNAATRYDYRLRIRNLAGEGEMMYASATTLPLGTDGNETWNPSPGGGSMGDWEYPKDPYELPKLPAPENFRLRMAKQPDEVSCYVCEWDPVVSPSEKVRLASYRVYATSGMLFGEVGRDSTALKFRPETFKTGSYYAYVAAVDQYGRESASRQKVTFQINPYLYSANLGGEDYGYSVNVEIKKMLNSINHGINYPGCKPYTYVSLNAIAPNHLWNCRAPFDEEFLSESYWTDSWVLEDYYEVDVPGYTGIKDRMTGAFNFSVKNHDGHARNIRFWYMFGFCPRTGEYPMAVNSSEYYNPEMEQLRSSQLQMTLASGQKDLQWSASFMGTGLGTLQKLGQIRLYIYYPRIKIVGNQDLDVDLDESETAAQPILSVVKKEVFDEESGRPLGPLYPLWIDPGMPQLERDLDGTLRYPMSELRLSVAKNLRIYVETVATGQFEALPLYDGTTQIAHSSACSNFAYYASGNYLMTEDLRERYFKNPEKKDKYRFYVQALSGPSGKIALHVTIGKKCIPLEVIPYIVNHGGMLADVNRDGSIDDSDDTLSKEKPFRFWINNDSDISDLEGNDIPGATQEPDYSIKNTFYGRLQSSSHLEVDGTRDLIDWFPVHLDIKDLLNMFSPGSTVKYKIKQEDSAVNMVYTNLSKNNVHAYLRDMDVISQTSGFGIDRSRGVSNARALWVTDSGLNDPFSDKYSGGVLIKRMYSELSASFLNDIKSGKIDGIILIEGRYVTDKPLVLTIEKDGVPVVEIKMPLKISPIEDMYRWVNLRHYAGEAFTKLSNVQEEPKNWPDAETNGKYFVFVHGYNVNENQSRAWGSESFKRMYWSGSSAKHYFVSWYGNDSQIAGNTPNFHVNVEHALETSLPFRDFINDLEGVDGQPADVTTCAHSLGNMLILDSLQLVEPARITSHIAFDAAIPAEALDGGFDEYRAMMHSDWDGNVGEGKIDKVLWASEWHMLFDGDDARSRLTWRNRLAKNNGAQIYNFYSSGEEVLNYAPFKPTPSWLESAWLIAADVNAIQGEFSWWGQELFKGRFIVDGVLGSDYGGWYFGPGHEKYDENKPRNLTPEEIKAYDWTNEKKRNEPLFLYGTEKKIALRGQAEESVFELYGKNGSDFAKKFHNKLLADVFPSLTPAMGRVEVAKINKNKDGSFTTRNFDLTNDSLRKGWPQERASHRLKENRWLHGDAKDIPYLYNHPVWDKWVEIGNLKSN